MIYLNLFSWQVNIVADDGRVIRRRSIPLNYEHIAFDMNATNCGNCIRSILESVKLNLLKLLLKIVTTLEIFNLSLLDSLSLLLISLFLLFVHLEVFVIKFLRVEIHIWIRLIFSFFVRFLLVIRVSLFGIFSLGFWLVLKDLGLLLVRALISSILIFDLDKVRV